MVENDVKVNNSERKDSRAMRPNTILGMLFSGAIVFALVGCAGGAPASAPESAAQEEAVVAVEGQEPESEEADDGGSAAVKAETTMPSGARPAGVGLAFPVPEGWPEIYPLTEEKVGGSMAWTAAFEFDGDAKSAAGEYQGLLKDAGFDANPYAPGEMTNDASLFAEGNVAGEFYKAFINFDTMADGTPRASLHLEAQ